MTSSEYELENETSFPCLSTWKRALKQHNSKSPLHCIMWMVACFEFSKQRTAFPTSMSNTRGWGERVEGGRGEGN